MRPIKLTMSAFGSYGGEETIDFTEIPGGLFLVTGDTGAGKTTIFDGITYALYDKTSGARRDGAMMRSQYADASWPTFVEFTFAYRGKRYTIRRNPEYERQSKRRGKDGNYPLVKESASVTLTGEDGEVFRGRKKETDAQIVRIMGVDFDQFTQIAMIAQGEFLRLLLADSKDRKSIFSRIFHTSFYDRVKEELRIREKEAAQSLRLLTDRAWSMAQRIDTSHAADEQKEKIEEICRSAADAPTALLDQLPALEDGLAELCDSLSGKTKEQKTYLSKLRTRIERLGVEIGQKEAENDALTRLAADEKRLGALLLQKEEIEEKKERVRLGKRAAAVREKKRQSQGAQQRKRALEEEMTAVTKQLENDRGRLSGAEDAYRRAVSQLEEANALLPRQRQILSLLIPRLERVEELKVQKEEALSALRDAIRSAARQGEMYEDTLARYFGAQAGVLAQSLEAGKPCPVCGATDHPRPARPSGDGISQKDVDREKRAYEKAQKETALLQQRFDRIESERETVETDLIRLQEELSGQEAAPAAQEERQEEPAALTKEQIQRRIRAIDVQLRTLADQAVSLEKEWDLIRTAIEKGTGRQENLAVRLQEQKEEVKRLDSEEQDAMELSGFADEKEYEAAAQYIDGMDDLAAKIAAFDEEKNRLEASVSVRKEQVSIQKPWDLAEDRASLTEAKRQQEAMEEEQHRLYAALQTNTEVLEYLGRYRQEMTTQLRAYEQISSLCRTAAGQLGGAAKLDLETYVQRTYFDRIVQLANRKLAVMNGGDFLLKCRSMDDLALQRQTGLDLDVIHTLTGTIRDVRSLSGGESFMAALAMALGLADMISSQAGAVRLETMFVDEGFGTLDDEARMRAIDILTELSGGDRLIGIISHVTELKEQIDRQLIIEKDAKGSHARWQM